MTNDQYKLFQDQKYQKSQKLHLASHDCHAARKLTSSPKLCRFSTLLFRLHCPLTSMALWHNKMENKGHMLYNSLNQSHGLMSYQSQQINLFVAVVKKCKRNHTVFALIRLFIIWASFSTLVDNRPQFEIEHVCWSAQSFVFFTFWIWYFWIFPTLAYKARPGFHLPAINFRCLLRLGPACLRHTPFISTNLRPHV